MCSTNNKNPVNGGTAFSKLDTVDNELISNKSIISNSSYIARPSTPSPDIWTGPDAVQDESKFKGRPATILDST